MLIPTESKEVAPPDAEETAQIARPRVRAIVVNWNGEALLRACLRALEAQRGPASLSVVVVDNGSTDGSLPMLAREFPQLEVIALAENLGYGKANNVALARALAEGYQFALLVNNDVELEPDYLACLLAGAQAHPDAALLTGTLLFRELANGKEQVNSTGLVVDWFGRARDRDFRVPRDQLQRNDGPVAGASGGAALLRCSALARIGLFDPDYFAYYEDVDLSLRAQAAGYSCWYIHGALARHRFGATFGPGSPTQRYLLGRNHLRTAGRHLPGLHAAAVIAGTVAYRLAWKTPLELLRGETSLASAEARAAADGFSAALKAWRSR